MKTGRRGLRVNKETLRRLSIGVDELARVAGGLSTVCTEPTADHCTFTCHTDTTGASLTGSRKC